MRQIELAPVPNFRPGTRWGVLLWAMSTTNPVHRLASLITALQKRSSTPPHNGTIGQNVAALMLGEDYEPRGQAVEAECFAALLNLALEALAYTRTAAPPKAQESYVAIVQSALTRITGYTMKTQEIAFSPSNFPTSDIEALKLVGLALPDDQRICSPEDIRRIVALIDDLIETITAASFDAELRGRMVQLLNTLRGAMQTVNIRGTAPALLYLDAALGVAVKAIVVAPEGEQRAEAQNVVSRVAALATTVTATVEAADKISPMVEAGMRMLGLGASS